MTRRPTPAPPRANTKLRDVWHKTPARHAAEAALKAPEGRFLHFVRHGQYLSETGALTPLGRQQAALLAPYFARFRIHEVISSDWIRAKETAAILASALELPAPRHLRLLREALPTTVRGMTIPPEKRAESKQRIERIIARWFRPTRATRHSIIVCHGNLIRALMLRAITGRVTGWQHIAVHHTGVTSFLVTPRSTLLLAYDRIDHLPPQFRTQS